jgi:5-oxoprolinase (ATP-hydrolysing) subunit C
VSGSVVIDRAGPLVTLQDEGRFGMLSHGIAASGPMDRRAYRRAGLLASGGTAAIEFTESGLAFTVEGTRLHAGCDGGDFVLRVNNRKRAWSSALSLKSGDKVDITPGAWGNYGYIRFDQEIDVAPVLGSRSTNSTVALGGFRGRALQAADRLTLLTVSAQAQIEAIDPATLDETAIYVVWGLHADLFASRVREAFSSNTFHISPRLDRMGVRLDDAGGIFAGTEVLSLVSDAVVPGDIQILGDGTPIVLMRDHQPTGGYPRIATVVSADLDRFAQLRPGTAVGFAPVGLAHASALRMARK